MIEQSSPAAVVERDERPQALTARHEPPTDTSHDSLLLHAMRSGATIEQLTTLAQLKEQMIIMEEQRQERADAKAAKKAFIKAMAAFKAEPMEILKRKLVSFPTKDQHGRETGQAVSYMHAELSDVTDAVVPAMAKHGLRHAWNIRRGTELQTGRIVVDCTITHEDGHAETVSLDGSPDDSGKKNSLQQNASTITYLQRYTLLAATGMATKGSDDDGRGAGDSDNSGSADARPSRGRGNSQPPPPPEDTPERRSLVADLFAKADEGLEALEKCWKELSKENRKLVGTATWADIKAKAPGAAP